MTILHLLLLLLVSPSIAESISYSPTWSGTPRRWIGPSWWANPLYDWSLSENTVHAPAASRRSLVLLRYDVADEPNGTLTLSATLRVSKNTSDPLPSSVAAGFLVGRQGYLRDFRSSLENPRQSIQAVVHQDGRLQLASALSTQAISLTAGAITLTLTANATSSFRETALTTLTLTASQPATESKISISHTVSPSAIAGCISLYTNGRPKDAEDPAIATVSFSRFHLSGTLVRKHSSRMFGPILWTQHTLSDNTLRLQAQFAPIETPATASLYVQVDRRKRKHYEGQWKRLATAPVHALSRTALFTVPKWRSNRSYRYEVRMKWQFRQHNFAGIIRREPKTEKIRIAALSCDEGYAFPLPTTTRQLRRQNPDVLFFAGDQIYEIVGGFGITRRASMEVMMLDFLRRYYQFGWTWRDLLRDRPSVILPDDHDIFQGNLFGNGGVRLPNMELGNKYTRGGYAMPGEWVSAVERCHVGHLPPPAVDMTLPIGIKPYFTSVTYGGLSIAVLEDRKFKTGPLRLPEAIRETGGNASLLGAEQEEFLNAWASDWKDADMKVVLSQTMFAKATTHAGQHLRRVRYRHDSGGWPVAARNRAVRAMGAARAFALHGDQHVGVLLRHGVAAHDDAGYALMVPGTANGFPRAWWPGLDGANQSRALPWQSFTGRFTDDAGLPITVLAAGNPAGRGSGVLEGRRARDPLAVAEAKGSGYGVVVFDKGERTAVVQLFRTGDRDVQFEGFPQKVFVGGRVDVQGAADDG